MLLFTDNRNMKSEDSLEQTIREEITAASLPVLTIGNTDRMTERKYREKCANRLAEIIYDCSPATFVAINCAAIPETLLESELFGHVKGAFTGADQDRKGKCWRARQGTLFLDEIGDMPLLLQVKVLRLLEDRIFEKVGSDTPELADFRVIVATHHNLEEDVLQEQFRSDLFHRLNVFPLNIPPLRQRREDIPQLVEQFMSDFRRHQGKSLPGLSKTAIECLMAHDWPGNVRELRNRLEYATIITNGELIQPEHLNDLRGVWQDTSSGHHHFNGDGEYRYI